MASVFFGRVTGAGGFARTVAVKRLHAPFSKDPEFIAMFLDEARLAARIRHPNVVPTLDVVATEGDVLLVLEYVHGESFARVQRAAREWGAPVDPRIVRAVLAGALHGLHAAHEAVSESGAPLGIIHRDVSPQNILIGLDGIARILDFGVAKASGRLQTTRRGQIKGKLAYMAPEQLLDDPIDRRIDVYAAGVVLWEALTGRRLFQADSEAAIVHKVISEEIEPPSRFARGISAETDAVVLRATARDPAQRYATARDMALALERAGYSATVSEVGAWCESLAGATLARRAHRIRGIEASSSSALATGAQEVLSAVESSARMASLAPFESAGHDAVRSAGARSRTPWSRRRAVAIAFTWLAALCTAGAVSAGALVVRKERSASARSLQVASSTPAGASARPRGRASARPRGAGADEPCPSGMVRVAGGPFFIGSDDPNARSAERPTHHVTLRSFCIDVTEVTALDYKACSDGGNCRRAFDTNAWATLTPAQAAALDPLCNARAPDERGRHPINCVTWPLADGFCRAHGKRLPTEAEWEFAARGMDGRAYPWGDERPNGKLLNACGKECAAWGALAHFDVHAMYGGDDGWPGTSPVGSFPAGNSVYGLNDMVGNVWEWVADWYGPYTAEDVADPVGPATGATRVVRGGAWNDGDTNCVRATYRFSADPEMRSHGIGFRCAK